MGRSVLVVDDDPAIHQLLKRTLELEGYAVTSALDGQEAVELVRDYLPDLVVLDVMMPRKDGYQVLQSLRSDVRTQHVPVVFLTARSSGSDVWSGWDQGADYYLTKPFDVEELLRYVEHVLSE